MILQGNPAPAGTFAPNLRSIYIFKLGETGKNQVNKDPVGRVVAAGCADGLGVPDRSASYAGITFVCSAGIRESELKL